MQLAQRSVSSIGIWGLGIVGRSLVSFLASRGYTLSLCDARELSDADKMFLTSHGVSFYQQQTSLAAFLASADAIVPSGGVDLRSYAAYADKWLPELDIFQHFCTKPVIAITGTLGKTTVTHTIATLLERAGKSVLTGGNIGVGLCDLLSQQELADYFVIEVSSFQLEYCRTFAPQYAVWTNLHPNHLDRHGDMQTYSHAKSRIFTQQTAGAYAFLPALAYNQIHHLIGSQTATWCSLDFADSIDPLVYCQDGFIKKLEHGHDRTLAALPSAGFAENWLFIAALFDVLDVALDAEVPVERGAVLAHRIELVATVAGRLVYNDSKATIMQATLGALKYFAGKRIHLLLGGLSKGVDRAPYIAQLGDKVSSVHMFGAEAQAMAAVGRQYVAVVTAQENLEDAYKNAFLISQPGDIILLSPGGSSFDLYANYQARGTAFVHFVTSSKLSHESV
jgi:UDP-N-acetylmuramoylalanine--D-glutamate ligase